MGLKLVETSDNVVGATKELYRPSKGNIPKRFSFSVFAYGSFDSATAKIQASPDDVTWLDVPLATWTTDTTANLELYAPYVRAVISGSATAASITVELT